MATIAAPQVTTYPKRFDASVPAAGHDDLYDHDVVNARLVPRV